MFTRSLTLLAWLMSATAAAQAAPGVQSAAAPHGPVPNAAPGSAVTTTRAKNASSPASRAPASPSAAAASSTATGSAASATDAPAHSAMPDSAQPRSDGLNPPPVADTLNAAESRAPMASAPASNGVRSDPLFVPGVVAISVGSAALLASLFTGLGAHGIYNSLERDCKNALCPSGKEDKIDSGKTLAVVSSVLTGVGIAGVGVGVALLIVAVNRSSDAEATPIARLRLSPGPTPLGVGATASF